MKGMRAEDGQGERECGWDEGDEERERRRMEEEQRNKTGENTVHALPALWCVC